MKKIKLFALAVMAMLSTNAFAQEYADGYLRYTTDGTNATITGFVASNKVAAVEIPATVKDPNPGPEKTYKVIGIAPKAFQNETIIESVNIADANVATISGGAFAGCTNLTTVTIGKKVSLIDNNTVFTPLAAGTTVVGTVYYKSEYGAGKYTETTPTAFLAGERFSGATPLGAFEGCTKLATVGFNPKGVGDPGELVIEGGTFAKTAIAKLDLTGSNVKTLNQLFETLNPTVTEVVLPVTLSTINDNAFKQLTKLNKIDWTACTVNGITINADAFDGAPLITSLVLPAKVTTLATNCLRGSNISTLTITSPAAGGALTVNATGTTKLTTLTLAPNAAGNFIGTLAAGAFIAATKLATININGDLQTKDQIAAGSFAGAGTDGIIVNYTPTSATAKATAAINKAAFAAASVVAANQNVTLKTSNAYGTYIAGNATDYPAATNGDVIFRVKIAFSEATFNLAVAKGGSSKYYYAKLYATAPYKIAKKQGDATVIVYQGYVDQSDANIYMENLRLFEGYYWVPAGAPVIVKSTAEDDVILTESAGTYTSTLTAGSGETNEIQVGLSAKGVATNVSGMDVNDYYAGLTPAKTPYAMAPIADYGYLWTKISDSRVIVGSANGAYSTKTKTTTADFVIPCNTSAAARLNVVWLDGSEDEATGIQQVKTVAEDGVIYNLAGQKVDAAYKGVVIKNGKKMIQK